jgi:sterol 3beta-glucosyltransferase
MAPEDDLKKRVARKLTKRRREGHQVTMEIPERFRDGDDADEDCTAPQGHNTYMNQSVFGMIAAAGSQVDFNARFDAQSSDEEEEAGEPSSSHSPDLRVNKQRNAKPASKPLPEKQHRRKFSEHKLLRSISGLSSRSKTKSPPKSSSPSHESLSEPSTPEIQLPRMPSHTPVMSRMLEAKAELSLRPSFDLSRLTDGTIHTDEDGHPSSNLALSLKEIFQFEKAEDVIEEYPCWLLKSVLLQGYMYITTKHICFYAYFPKKSVGNSTVLIRNKPLIYPERSCQVWISLQVW